MHAMQAIMAVHFIRNAMATVLLSQKRTSPASETKPGKAPKDVEYVGGSLTHYLVSVLQRLHELNVQNSSVIL